MVFALGFHVVSDALAPISLAVTIDPFPGQQAVPKKPPHGAKRKPLALVFGH